MDLNLPMDSQTIRSYRSQKRNWDPEQPQGFLVEEEPDGQGGVLPTATYFLTGSECRFTCAFCDLWKYTFDQPTPVGSLVRQVRALNVALHASGRTARWLKLYNASNFFDPQNVPESDLPEIARSCEGFERIVVENHAVLLRSSAYRQRILRFADQLHGRLEIAMGLESIDPKACSLMNKSMHLSDFAFAAKWLAEHGIATRAFVLLQPPGTCVEESVDWAARSTRFAFDVGVERCCIIPTRAGNGWIDALQESAYWWPPTADQLEQALRAVLGTEALHGHRSRPVATVDLWDWEQLPGGCDNCRPLRYDGMLQMNLLQNVVPREPCSVCEGEPT